MVVLPDGPQLLLPICCRAATFCADPQRVRQTDRHPSASAYRLHVYIALARAGPMARSGNKNTTTRKKTTKNKKKPKSQGKSYRRHPDSNQGPLDLQSNALPLSYTSMTAIARPTPTESAHPLSMIDFVSPCPAPSPKKPNPKSVQHGPNPPSGFVLQFSESAPLSNLLDRPGGPVLMVFVLIFGVCL